MMADDPGKVFRETLERAYAPPVDEFRDFIYALAMGMAAIGGVSFILLFLLAFNLSVDQVEPRNGRWVPPTEEARQ